MAVQVGDVLEGKVTGVKPFGAFVALPGGEVGLVHISEISYEFVQDITSVLQDGQPVKVKVISMAPDGKIALSIKRTQPQPDRKSKAAPKSTSTAGQHVAKSSKKDTSARVWQPKQASPKTDLTFEDMMAHYKTQSEEKIADLRRVTENHRGGYSRRRG